MQTPSHLQNVSDTSNARSNSRQASFLMCPPDYFGILYEINPWMKREVQPDSELAKEQWNALVAHLKEAGAQIELLQPVATLPDMVFTADLGLVYGHRFITSHFRYPERQAEVRHCINWFQSRHVETIELPLEAGASLESSDIYPFREYLVAGYGFRTTRSAHSVLAELVQRQVVPVEFVDARFYHLDLSFRPLDDRRAIIAPDAWSRRSCELIEQLVPEPLVLDLDEALTFCTNSILVGKTIVMPACPPRVGRILEQWGFTVCLSPVSEFLKAGGAVHCLALAINGVFSAPVGER